MHAFLILQGAQAPGGVHGVPIMQWVLPSAAFGLFVICVGALAAARAPQQAGFMPFLNGGAQERTRTSTNCSTGT